MINILNANPVVEGQTDSLAMAEEAIRQAGDKTGDVSIGFWELFTSGGWLMWVLVALAAVMIFIFVERFIAIRKATRIDNNFMNRIRDYISEGNINAAIDLCRRTD
ncbi:MAG: hypothetical protein IJB56_02480, partial [Alistipes sp.]|nr:hypothetical protein [Alistipes sp.]